MQLHKVYKKFTMVFCLLLLQLSCAEWIEIKQKPRTTTTMPSSTKSGMFQGKSPSDNMDTTVSPVWIAYQKERFGNQRQAVNTNHLVVRADQSLRNSAQIIVPARTAARNQVVRAKTKLDVVKESPTEASSVATIETSSRTLATKSTNHLLSPTEPNRKGLPLEPEVEDLDLDLDEEESEEVNESHDMTMPSLKGFIEFIKDIRKSWIYNAGTNLEEKIQYLMNFKELLMLIIQRKLRALWQPIDHQRRHKRGILEESSISFPPQAALMSITFLTFAVFLIKLVLQVVHIVKSKHYNIGTIGANTSLFHKS